MQSWVGSCSQMNLEIGNVECAIHFCLRIFLAKTNMLPTGWNRDVNLAPKKNTGYYMHQDYITKITSETLDNQKL
jgi:hypothetical protein